MHDVRFENPQAFWLLPLVALLAVALAVRGRAVQGGARYRLIVGTVRFVWLALCVMALARPWKEVTNQRVDKLRVAVLVDRSDSLSRDDAAATQAKQRLVDLLGPEAEVRTTEFSSAPWVENHPAPDPSQTNIEAAIAAADRGNADSANLHLVVVSDSRQTQGDAIAAARRVAGRGGSVHVLAVGTHRPIPPRIARVEPPVGLKVGVESAVAVTVASEERVSGTVRLRDPYGHVTDERSLPVQGEATLLMHLSPKQEGALRYSIEFVPGGAAASRRDALVYAQGPPRLLIADSFPDEVRALKKALEPLGLPVDVRSPSTWPADLAPYACVVISDFSGKELSEPQRVMLRRYVEQSGGGLVFIAGNNVVPSRWNRNELAKALPFTMRERPRLAVVKPPEVSVCYVIDRSGSMGQGLEAGGGAAGGVGPTSKLELVKAAIQASVQTLPDTAQVAVIAFSGDAQTAVPPTSINTEERHEQVARQIDGIACGGGTVMAGGINEGMRVLASMPGDKYIVVLSDGVSAPPSGETWDDIADNAAAQQFSWTSIAVGPDADQKLLRSMATRAGGAYHYCRTSDQVPRVFIEQAKAVRQSSEKTRKPVRPVPGPNYDRYQGPPSDALPELSGSVLTEPKPLSETLLSGDHGGPLLARWPFGLGHVVAFSSDAKAAWASRWMEWQGFAAFWQPIVKGVLRVPQEYAVTVRSHTGVDSRAHFAFQIRSRDGRPVAGLSASSEWLAESRATSTIQPADNVKVAWRETQPGDYEADVPNQVDVESRPLLLSLDGRDGPAVRFCAYMPELPQGEVSQTGADPDAARSIALAGHGIASGDPKAVASACGGSIVQTIRQRSPLWHWFVAAALLFWPIDVLARRIIA